MRFPAALVEVVRRLPRDADAFYAISDLDAGRRIGGLLWIFGAVIVAVLMPVAPPTHHVGHAGWAVGATVVALCVLASLPLLVRPERVTPSALLAMSYAAAALIVLMVWLGGRNGPYSELFIIPIVYAAAMHPPRRVALFFMAVVFCLALPLVYDGWNGTYAAQSLVHVMLWFSLAAVAMLFTGEVRLDRLVLLQGEARARQLARRDALTGLGNRRAFDEELDQVVTGARRSDRPLTLVIADIAGFKSVNDTHGHLEGDRCLREVAEVLDSTVRPADACFRWGGDEFAILLPATDAVHAHAVIQRVERAVASTVVAPDGRPLRLRYGVAEITRGMDARGLVAAADQALIAATYPAGKATG